MVAANDVGLAAVDFCVVAGAVVTVTVDNNAGALVAVDVGAVAVADVIAAVVVVAFGAAEIVVVVANALVTAAVGVLCCCCWCNMCTIGMRRKNYLECP